ncbi:exodeoxyribonuclease VII large subunit [Ectothiorhodospira lacustris]|uniref:exodeoxyribonuclease VII large subunit n=1 Tax=Ectothiorhodospira lacustris TaxID=2899127 RepID=UPI001EE7D0E3|nr:exodeoxyribonuclease VII large subunit [Ectothiorhodospira lacustris]MCG5510962.1 exodeoxyribonuclease VII large subunit [Ectothiorhodospira lacustris]MCG5522694.1 exodeoxyribonuclease VII large subunit [Ectothiorhodospira lacustris]
MPDQVPEPEIYSVSRLNQTVQEHLESGFALLWVEGELSNLARPASGHWYFSLKDAGAQVRCALFRNRAQGVRFRPRDGMQVLARARISLYVPRGDYQLIVEHLEEAGDGALRRSFEALHRKLKAEGLFDTALKRPLPRFPRRVGVITSATGAAVRDILAVLKRRFPALPVMIYPVPVQGSEAAPRIAAALEAASARGDCDVLILARGGGSLEDLWAFNEEIVARAIRTCTIPVVSGIGHETDITIADFAADQRAPTPSVAAELVSPDGRELLQRVNQLERLLSERFSRRLQARSQQLQALEQRLRHQHPERRLRARAQRLDELESRLRQALARRMREQRAELAHLWTRLGRCSPQARITDMAQQRRDLSLRMERAMALRLERLGARVSLQARTLHAVSPLATLGRGYSILLSAEGRAVRAPEQVKSGERLEAHLAQGRLWCRVE